MKTERQRLDSGLRRNDEKIAKALDSGLRRDDEVEGFRPQRKTHTSTEQKTNYFSHR
jgi:hypothetical protein